MITRSASSIVTNFIVSILSLNQENYKEMKSHVKEGMNEVKGVLPSLRVCNQIKIHLIM